jgi:hypothetical protein
MPTNLASGAIASTTTTDISAIKIRKNLGQNRQIGGITTASIGATGKKRSIAPLSAIITSGLIGTLKRRLKLGVGVIASSIESEVRFFLSVSPAAPPKGNLFRADLSTVQQPGSSPPSFAGSRLVKGDLIPLTFKIQGQKLSGLNAVFTAKRKDDPTADPITKSGFHQTSPAIDAQTKIEAMMGSFAIESADTEDFPDSEIELSYTLKFTDGIGRIYTVESGSFTVYSTG